MGRMHVTKRTYHDFCGRISVLTRFIDPMGLTGVFGLVADRATLRSEIAVHSHA